MEKKKGTKTLLMSILMSAPGPLVLGIGLMMGQSNTQIADFIRRSIELLAIIASFMGYQITIKKQLNEQQEKKLERNINLFVGATMLVAGIIMLGITLFSKNDDSGNVLFSLIIAILGVIANSMFWFKYQKLSKVENSDILAVQAKLYRAKTMVDLCVTTALLAVLIAPQSQISYYLDVLGSVVVSIYLAYSGVKIIIEKLKYNENMEA